MKLHLEGKTDQARADLARLAIIKKQREEAAKKREELRKGEFNMLSEVIMCTMYARLLSIQCPCASYFIIHSEEFSLFHIFLSKS